MAGRITRRRLLGGVAAGALAGRWARAPSPAAAAELAAPWCSLDAGPEPSASIGAPSALPVEEPRELVGEWTAPFRVRAAVVGVHAILLRTGKVLLVEGPRAAVWDPADGTARRIQPPEDLFCAGHCVLGDGRVFFAGGAKTGPPPNWTVLFDPVTETFELGPTMRQGRWYPTATALPDGDHVLITTGDVDRSGVVNEDVEVYSALDGTVGVVGTRRFGLYPHQKVTPDGRVLIAGPARHDVAVLDPVDWSWTELPILRAMHQGGGGVLLPGGPDGPHEVMLYGSTSTSGVMVESFDVLRPEDGWRRRAKLPGPRAHMNSVILPDGTVLGVGGSNQEGNLHESLLYDPVADTWTPMAAQLQVRGYHSTALLLPDGRVLSAGDNREPGGFDTLELYSPPYLYRGERPTIRRAPEAISWGAAFEVLAGAPVTRAVLLRPGSVTHTNEMDQRHVELAVTVTGRLVQATAPASGTVAPAGWYLLFLVDAAGVPSKGAWVHVGP